jgi:hypothetical protein
MVLFNIIRGQSCKLIKIIKQNMFYSISCEVSSCNNIIELVAGDLPVVISVASLALADAGILMYDLVASVSVV